MRPFLLNVTLHAALAFVVLFAIRLLAAKAGAASAPAVLFRRLLGDRRLALLLAAGAAMNLSLRLAAGYINPRDFLQDAVAARQLAAGRTLYPEDLRERATAETAGPFAGEAQLRAVPVLEGEFRRLQENVNQNAHPPLAALVAAGPVAVLGTRYSFLFLWALSSGLLYAAFGFVLRELFGGLGRWERISLLAAAFGWYPVVAALRSGQSGVLLFALYTAAWAMLRRGRPGAAGIPVAAAASLHAFPGLLFVHLLFRAPKSAASGAAALLGLNGIMAVVAGPGTFAEWLRTAGAVSGEYLPYRANLSVAGIIACLGRAWGGGNGKLAAGLVTAAAVAAMAAWAWRRRKAEPSQANLDLEFAACTIATLLASPVCWDRYFPILLLPLAVLVRYGDGQPRTAVWMAGLVALVSVPGDSLDALFGFLTPRVGTFPAWLATSLPTFALVAALVALARRRVPAGTG